MKRLINTILILFLGQPHARTKRELRPALKNQRDNIARIWNNEQYSDFGFERLIRLGLALSQFFFIGLYVRHVSGIFGLQGRKIGVELYVTFKLLLPLTFLSYRVTDSSFVAWAAAYMATETVTYLATLIFLSNEFAEPISYRRSLFTLFLNYIEVCSDFAILYSHFNNTLCGFFNKPLASNMQAVYFSFVTSATVGYGDIYPVTPLGQLLVIIQILLFLAFAALFLNFFASKLQALRYFDTENSKKANQS